MMAEYIHHRCPFCGGAAPVNLTISTELGTVARAGKAVRLTNLQMQVFALLYAARPGLVSTDALMTAISGKEWCDCQILKTTIHQVRQRIKYIGLVIRTAHRRGYFLANGDAGGRVDLIEGLAPVPVRTAGIESETARALKLRGFTTQQIAARLRRPYKEIIAELAA